MTDWGSRTAFGNSDGQIGLGWSADAGQPIHAYYDCAIMLNKDGENRADVEKRKQSLAKQE